MEKHGSLLAANTSCGPGCQPASESCPGFVPPPRQTVSLLSADIRDMAQMYSSCCDTATSRWSNSDSTVRRVHGLFVGPALQTTQGEMHSEET